MKASVAKPWLKYYDPKTLAQEMPDLSIFDYLKWRNKDKPDHVALSYFDREIMLSEVYESVEKTAAAYTALGVKENDIVVVISATTPEIIYTFYGLSLIGAIPNMVDPRYSAEEIREVIEEVDAHFVLTLDVAYDKVVEAREGTHVEKVIVLSPANSLPQPKKFLYCMAHPMKNNMPEGFVSWSTFFETGKDHPFNEIHDRADRCCVIVHTGGTTGPSKSVMLSDRNINAVSFSYKICPIHTETTYGKDKFLNVMPPFIAYGLGYGVHLPLGSALVCIIIPQLDPQKLASLVMKYKPQDMASVPSHFLIMMRDRKMKNADLSFFKNSCAGGDALPIPDEIMINEFLKSHNAKYPLTKGYGMTELAAVSTACMRDINRLGSVGIPHGKFIISIFDPETGEELDIGKSGEVCVTGPSKMMGYYNNEKETNNIIRMHSDGLKWVHTGDIGHMDEDGFLYIEGRIKRMIVRHDGFKIFPTLIENVLALNEDVDMCAAVGMKDKTQLHGQIPAAFVTLKKGCTKLEEEVISELRKLCKENLAEYRQPAKFVVLDKMPLTGIGKIDFVTLEKKAADA